MSYDSPELLLISSNIFYWPWKTWKQSRTEHVPMWHSPPSMLNLTYPASSETWPKLLIKCGHWTSSRNICINVINGVFLGVLTGTSSIKFYFLDDTSHVWRRPTSWLRASSGRPEGTAPLLPNRQVPEAVRQQQVLPATPARAPSASRQQNVHFKKNEFRWPDLF